MDWLHGDDLVCVSWVCGSLWGAASASGSRSSAGHGWDEKSASMLCTSSCGIAEAGLDDAAPTAPPPASVSAGAPRVVVSAPS